MPRMLCSPERVPDLHVSVCLQEAAAVKIQAVQRGREARKEVQEMKAAKANAVDGSKPASEVGLEVLDIERSPEEEAAAVKIQAVQRGREARKEVEAIKEHREQVSCVFFHCKDLRQ